MIRNYTNWVFSPPAPIGDLLYSRHFAIQLSLRILYINPEPNMGHKIRWWYGLSDTKLDIIEYFSPSTKLLQFFSSPLHRRRRLSSSQLNQYLSHQDNQNKPFPIANPIKMYYSKIAFISAIAGGVGVGAARASNLLVRVFFCKKESPQTISIRSILNRDTAAVLCLNCVSLRERLPIRTVIDMHFDGSAAAG